MKHIKYSDIMLYPPETQTLKWFAPIQPLS